ncbi:MAG: ABC transporter ATP-binding protein [Acidimicrobiia bacterium]
MEPAGAAVVVKGLRKSYGSRPAVQGVDLEVQRGEVFALLGPNGAGKTTIVEILEGYRKLDSGTVSVLGRDPSAGGRALREQIGIVLQSGSLDPYLTAAETVELYRQAYPRPRPVAEVLELVGLTDARDVRAGRLSGGQKRRLEVAVALGGDPELLFLDEPTTGFDPGARRNAWEVVRNLASLGKTILLTTHYLDEAEALAERVAILVAGEIVAEGQPASLRNLDATTVVSFRLPAASPAPPDLGTPLTVVSGAFEIRTTDPTGLLHRLTAWAMDHRLALEGLEVRRPSLEDVYLEITAPSERDTSE